MFCRCAQIGLPKRSEVNGSRMQRERDGGEREGVTEVVHCKRNSKREWGINKINCELRFHIPICCCCILYGCEKGDYENKVDAP